MRVPGHPSLHLVGVDPFQALRVQPALLGNQYGNALDLLQSDAVILSRAAAEELNVARGGEFIAQAGTRPVTLHVVAVLPLEANAQRIAFADIATAQWRLDRLGVINRIDVRLARDANAAEVTTQIEKILHDGKHDGVEVGDVNSQSQQAEAMTRAYRVNLDMLALVALFTGSFLVFATQALTILQRRAEIAILRVLGVTRGGILRTLLTESMAVGAAGAVIGLIAGYALAWFALTRFGGDLGAGYFDGSVVALNRNPVDALAFFALGVVAAMAGCFVPAWQAAASDPGPALKAANATDDDAKRRLWPGFALLALTVPLLAVPPVHELPVGGYAGIATLLAGALWLAPAFADLMFRQAPSSNGAVPQIAIEQLRG